MAKVNQVIDFGQTQMPFPSYEQNPTNFFWRFSQENLNEKAQLSTSSESEEEQEQELNLCLSLGGIYAKPTKEKNQSNISLARSSSIAGKDSEIHRTETVPFLSLSRSCSLPSGEETVRLRELQTMRRMAAKRRLAEKQRGSRDEEERAPAPMTENLTASEIAAWAAASAAKSAALGRAICKIKGQECSTAARGKTSWKSTAEPSTRFSSATMMISNRGRFVNNHSESNPPQNPLKKVKSAPSGKVVENWVDVMNRMPSVTTTGGGPNGKRIDGFLYKYSKGQVSIVCVCHGSFLSPAEFVKHAGGNEVANPMRHINVCTALPL